MLKTPAPWTIQFRGPLMIDKSAAAILLGGAGVVIVYPVDDTELEFDRRVRVFSAYPVLKAALGQILAAVSKKSQRHDSLAYHQAVDLEMGIGSMDVRVLWNDQDPLSADIIDKRGHLAVKIKAARIPSDASDSAALASFRETVKAFVAAAQIKQCLQDLVSEARKLGLRQNAAQIRMAEAAIAVADPPRFTLLKDDRVMYRGTQAECRQVIARMQVNSVFWALKHGGWRIDPAKNGDVRARNHRALSWSSDITGMVQTC